MNQMVLFEDEAFQDLLPLTFWRSVFELLIGRSILLDHTAQKLGRSVGGVWTRDWIARVAEQRCGAPANRSIEPGAVLVNGRWLPGDEVAFPRPPCVGVIQGAVAFVVCDEKLAQALSPRVLLCPEERAAILDRIPTVAARGSMIRYPWDVVAGVENRLQAEWSPGDARIEGGSTEGIFLQGKERIHIGERANIHPSAVLDATSGPIYISHDVVLGAHALIEGPAYLGPGTRVNPHTWLHGGNAIGPICKVGGEINGCVLHGYSNKQHQGYLGHSIVGSWVNIGAGATNSDLKNTYGTVRVPICGTSIETNLTFLGAVLGDYAKVGINATIPSGAVVGFASTITGSRLMPKFLPSFAWFAEGEVSAGDPSRLLDAATKMMIRRKIDLTDDEVELFLDLGERVRMFEKSA